MATQSKKLENVQRNNEKSLLEENFNKICLLSNNGKGKNHMQRILNQISNENNEKVWHDWDRG